VADEPAPGAPVFPGARTGKPLSGMALSMLVRRMNTAAPSAAERGIGGEAGPPRWSDALGNY
jgi:hypothetical protein